MLLLFSCLFNDLGLFFGGMRFVIVCLMCSSAVVLVRVFVVGVCSLLGVVFWVCFFFGGGGVVCSCFVCYCVS